MTLLPNATVSFGRCARVDDDGPGEAVGEVVDAGLEDALVLAGRVVLGVLAEVAHVAGRGDPLGHLDHLDVPQAVEFGLELVVPFPRHRDAVVSHGRTLLVSPSSGQSGDCQGAKPATCHHADRGRDCCKGRSSVPVPPRFPAARKRGRRSPSRTARDRRCVVRTGYYTSSGTARRIIRRKARSEHRPPLDGPALGPNPVRQVEFRHAVVARLLRRFELLSRRVAIPAPDRRPPRHRRSRSRTARRGRATAARRPRSSRWRSVP